jgi:hypothetical protein
MKHAHRATGRNPAGPRTARVPGAVHGLRRHPLRVTSALCLLGAGLYAAAEPGWASRQIALSFTTQQAHYSELYFASFAALPEVSRPGREATVRFTIVNREGRAYRYSYVVSLASPGDNVQAARRLVTVKDGGHADVTAHFTPKAHHAPYTVTIRIEQPDDLIEFHGRTS